MNNPSPDPGGSKPSGDRAGAHLLDIPSLTLHEGEILSLIGPNGAGKTTLLQTLAYLLRPFQGEIYFKGRKVGSDYSVFEYRRKLAMVFQEPLLFDTTVFNNVATGLRIRGIGKEEIYWQGHGQPGPFWNRSPRPPVCTDPFRGRSPEDEPCPGVCHRA